MVKNKIANKRLGMLVAVTMALGMLTNALPVPAGIAEASSATNTTETAFTYASRNVVLDKTAKAYAIDTTATNKMGAEVTKILGNNNNGGKEKAGWISELTDGVFGSFNGAGIAGFNGGNDGRGLGWFVLDAGAQYAVHSVCVDLVHDWGTSDLLIQLSATESFENPITVYSNDVDGSLGYGDVVTGDFSDVYTESINGGTLMNVLNSGRTFNFAPVSARYIRVTGDAFGNGHRQGYTQFGEIQMFAYETAGTAGPASVDPVTFSSAGGTFSEAAKVTLSAAAGAEIYYTTDGSVPTEKSTKYTVEIDTADFSNACVIRAAAKVNGTMGLPTHGTFAHGFVGNPNVALGRSVKFYKVDTSAANKMGIELTGSGTRGNLTERTGIFKDGQSFSNAVNGNFSEGSLSIMNADWQNKIPGSSTTGENIYGTGVTTESGGGENLWEMKEYFWTVVDFGESKDIESVQVAFVGDTRGVCIQLSNDTTFTTGVTTVYCDNANLADVTAGANVGGNWTNNNKEIKLSSAVNARYIRATGWAVSDARYWTHNVPKAGEAENIETNTFNAITSDYETLENGQIKEHFIGTNLAEVAAITTLSIKPAPALQAYVISVNDAFGEAITLESVANGSSANSITENLPEKVTLVGSDGQEHSNVAGTWSAPKGFDGYTAGDYTFTFTPDSTEGLPVDAYGVATVVVTVEAQADLATLNATLETAAAKQETDYTTSTWNAFTQAKTAAETVKNATLKTQREVDKANDDLTAAMNALAARADVTELSAELTKHTDKKENQYTTSTWSAFAKAKEAAQAFVNDNSVATQAEVDRAKKELEAAAVALVLRADTTDLSAAYEAARTAYGTESTSSTYTRQTWSDYLEAMTTAKAIIDDNSNAAQAQADAAKEAIETAIDGFVQKAAQADVDALLAEVTKLRADESKYTAASYAEFKSILGTTEDAVGGAEVTKEAFDAAKAAFDEAKTKLVAVGDATELKALIATKVEAQNAYTTASWRTYSEALSAANTAAAGGKPQAEIDAAKAALQTAIDGLVKIGDKTALTDLVAKAKAKKEIGKDLANAINAAQEVLDKADATQTEVDEAVAALQSALDNNKVSRGCGASMAGSGSAVAFVLAAGACALCLKKRKEKNIQ